MTINTNPNAVEQVLTRGVAEGIGTDALRARLLSGERLRVKLGIDPTSPHIHLGRSIPLLKLRDFQELGHQVVLIIGDFTGVIGDTSDKESERPMLEAERVRENMATYVDQVKSILDVSACEVHYNSAWLGDLRYGDIGKQADAFSLAEFIARDNIARRLEAGTRISLRELLYPLMQGYDSVAVRADVELGGMDQRFNLLAGRTLQETYGQKPQAILMNPLVAGTDGRKMSSSWGNTIPLTAPPDDMFGKVMRIPDEHIITYFEHMTRMPMERVEEWRHALRAGENPKAAKTALAKAIVELYHGSVAAEGAEQTFARVFSQGELPADMPELACTPGLLVVDALVALGWCTSRGEARRQVEQGGVHLNDQLVESVSAAALPGILQKGKRFFARLT
jgi:tyrosyl-tRNA synthetase